MSEKKSSAAGSALEWIAATAGALITLLLIGVIGWQAATTRSDAPPALTVKAERVVRGPGGFVVEITASNSGDTAAGVEIEGSLKQSEAEVEKSRATIDYVPRGGRRRAGLLFARNPALYRLEIRATGYQEP